jgi:hypothetical protein
MYDDQLTRIPANDDELWQVLTDSLDLIEMTLLDTAVETEDAALEARDSSFMSIRYRGVSVEEDNRDYFLEMGRELLPLVRGAVAARDMSPGLIQRWGMLQFCHGYIAAHILDDTDPLVSRRAGLKRGRQVSKNTQRKWLAHVILGLRKMGWTRAEAEERVVEIIEQVRTSNSIGPGFDDAWYKVMITVAVSPPPMTTSIS